MAISVETVIDNRIAKYVDRVKQHQQKTGRHSCSEKHGEILDELDLPQSSASPYELIMHPRSTMLLTQSDEGHPQDKAILDKSDPS